MKKLTDSKIQKIKVALIAKKKKNKFYNVALEDKEQFKITGIKGLSFSMAISTYDDKPFEKKRVRITAHASGGDCFMQRDILILNPIEAGYDKKDVMSHVHH